MLMIEMEEPNTVTSQKRAFVSGGGSKPQGSSVGAAVSLESILKINREGTSEVNEEEKTEKL